MIKIQKLVKSKMKLEISIDWLFCITKAFTPSCQLFPYTANSVLPSIMKSGIKMSKMCSFDWNEA